MKISENKLVILQYKLSVKTENGELELTLALSYGRSK